MITRFYLPLLSTNVKHPKFGCHVTSLCQGLHRSAGSGGEDPENQVAEYGVGVKNSCLKTLLLDYFGVSLQNSQKITIIIFSKSNRLAFHPFLFETLKNSIINNLRPIIIRLRLFHFMGA